MNGMTPEQEEATIGRCLDLLEKTSGQRPVGWLSPSLAFSPHTLDLLGPAKLQWHGDARDSDLPRVVSTKGGQMAHIPWSDFTDNRVLRSSSMDLWDVYKEAFDYLYQCEPGSYLPLSLHCHNGGRPMITAIYHKLFSLLRPVSRHLVRLARRNRRLGAEKPVRARSEAPAQGVSRGHLPRVPGWRPRLDFAPN